MHQSPPSSSVGMQAGPLVPCRSNASLDQSVDGCTRAFTTAGHALCTCFPFALFLFSTYFRARTDSECGGAGGEAFFCLPPAPPHRFGTAVTYCVGDRCSCSTCGTGTEWKKAAAAAFNLEPRRGPPRGFVLQLHSSLSLHISIVRQDFPVIHSSCIW